MVELSAASHGIRLMRPRAADPAAIGEESLVSLVVCGIRLCEL